MSFIDLAAQLVGEPWCLTPGEIGRLTIGQVCDLYHAPRDKDGQLKPRGEDRDKPPISPRQEFIEKWRRWGLSENRAAEKWADEQAAKKAEKKARKCRKTR